MSALFRIFRETLRPHRPARRHSFSLAVEGLDQRALLSGGMSHALAANGAASLRHHGEVVHRGHSHALAAQAKSSLHPPGEVEKNGTVTEKKPFFYPNFDGPQIPQFLAVKASGKLLKNGSFAFTGGVAGPIDPNVPETFVIGLDRNGHIPLPGPIPDRPDLQGDATVYVQVRPGIAPVVKVYQSETNQYTVVQNPAVAVSGKSVSVNIPGNMLPSTGLAPSHYRFVFWTYDPVGDGGQETWLNTGSCAPAFLPLRVGKSRA